MTELLYHHDARLLRFEAPVAEIGALDGKATLVLTRTAFYPEAGGQMADRGTLAGRAVLDVQLDDAGRVHHLLDGDPATLPGPGSTVSGDIEPTRRRAHMALHTGQHMLSRALEDEAGAATVSSRLGESLCTIDTDREHLDEARVARAEALVNAVVDDDVPVRAFFPDAAELARLPLRRPPKVTDHIRVITVGDFDATPCGGTHVSGSAQVGLVRVTGIERYKGKARVTFVAGPRARRELFEQADILRGLGSELTCGPADVRAAIERLRRDWLGAREALGHARGRLAEAAAVALASQTGPVVGVIEDADAEMLRAVATRLLACGAPVVILGGRGPEGVAAMVARGTGSDFDCGAFLRRVASAAGGRGGGKPDRAEGRLPAGADWEALVRSELAR